MKIRQIIPKWIFVSWIKKRTKATPPPPPPPPLAKLKIYVEDSKK